MSDILAFSVQMENALAGYQRPTQRDLKVGDTLELDVIGVKSMARGAFRGALSHVTSTGESYARAVGSKVWDPKLEKFKALASKFDTLRVVFEDVFGGDDMGTIQEFSRQPQDMSWWWQKTGVVNVRSYAASLFFIFESDSDSTNLRSKPPVWKIINFTHVHDFQTTCHGQTIVLPNGLNLL